MAKASNDHGRDQQKALKGATTLGACGRYEAACAERVQPSRSGRQRRDLLPRSAARQHVRTMVMRPTVETRAG